MCSWFCGTFCCFLVRFRDSYIRSTSISYPNRPRSSEVDHPQFPRSSEGVWELSASAPRDAEGQHATNVQPSLRAPMPQLGSSSRQVKDTCLPPIKTIFDSGGSRWTGAHNSYSPNHTILWAPNSFPVSSGEAVVEDQTGDIGLLPSSHNPHIATFPVYQHPQTLPQPSPHQVQFYLPQQNQASMAQWQTDTSPTPIRAKTQLNRSPRPNTDGVRDKVSEARDPSAVLTSFDTEPTASDFATISYLIDCEPDTPHEGNKKMTDERR